MNFFSDKISGSLSLFSENSKKYTDFLDKIGKICAENIAPNASKVDRAGVKLEENFVVLPPETLENIENLKICGYVGATLPEIYGGKALPKLFDIAAIEMISGADASLMTLVSLTEIGRLIFLYGTEEQKNRILPGIAEGKLTCATALTESGAGSDLQAVSTVAREENGEWYLSGLKHFVTNGGADVMLVLARSEEGVSGGRGLSVFIRAKNADDNCRILKTLDKHGICGSPTCTVRFERAHCELLGKRRFGLVKYTLELLLAARLSVAAQALGIAEAALNEAGKYAENRVQFGKKIGEIPQVAAMLERMWEKVDLLRLLLYFTAAEYDEMQALPGGPQSSEAAEKAREIRAEIEFLVPLVKFFAAETAEKAAHDCMQIHGGNGYLRGVTVERLFRDARVTSIYEGTSQIQVEAVVRKIVGGTFAAFVGGVLRRRSSEDAVGGKIFEMTEKLTRLAVLSDESGKIGFGGEYFARATALLSAAAVASVFRPERFSDGGFFSRLFVEVDCFLSAAGVS